MIDPANVPLVDLLARHLRAHPGVRWNAGWADYDEEVWQGVWACHRIAGIDLDYAENRLRRSASGPDEATWDTLATFFTSLAHGERWEPGITARAVEDGSLAAMVARLQQLLAVDGLKGARGNDHPVDG